MSKPTYRLLRDNEVIQETDEYTGIGEGYVWVTPLDFQIGMTVRAATDVYGKFLYRRKVTSKPPKSSHTTFTVPIYNCEVTLAVTKDLRDVPFEVSEEDRETYTHEDEANVFHIGRRLLVAFKPGLLSHDTITHELFHVTHYILSRANVRLTKKSDEAHAYLAGFLAGETYKALKKITKERIK